MGIILISLASIIIMYALTLVSYLSENKLVDKNVFYNTRN